MAITEINLLNGLLFAALVHIFEEYVFPGGFEGKFREMLARVNLKVTNSWLIFTNILFLSVVVFAQTNDNIFLGLAIVSIAFINGLLHIRKSIHARRYFPGLESAAFLYIPLGILTFLNVDLTP